MQCVLFKLGQGEYGFDIRDVQEIVIPQEYTKMPNVPEFIEGVINLRGKITPVLDLAKKFNLNTIEEKENTRLIVLNLGHGKQIAIKASEVTEVRTIVEADIEDLPDLNKYTNHCLAGIAKLEDKLVMLVDVNKIIDAEELPQLGENGMIVNE